MGSVATATVVPPAEGGDPATAAGVAPPAEAVVLRDGRPEDEALVMDSWRGSYRRSSGDLAHVSEKRYRDCWTPVAQRLLARSHLLCAVLESVPGVVFGWMLWESSPGRRVVHYLYVKADARRQGVARLLMCAAGIVPEAAVVYTHRTPALHAWRRVHRTKWEFDPWLAWMPDGNPAGSGPARGGA